MGHVAGALGIGDVTTDQISMIGNLGVIMRDLTFKGRNLVLLLYAPGLYREVVTIDQPLSEEHATMRLILAN